jgi:hypothetical protein
MNVAVGTRVVDGVPVLPRRVSGAEVTITTHLRHALLVS